MSQRSAILFDASRLLSRTGRGAPTGVDRVCLAYAEWLLSRPDVRMIPVQSRNDQLVTVDRARFADCVERLRARWNGDYFDRELTAHETRLLAALQADGAERQSVISPPPPQARPTRAPKMRAALRRIVRPRRVRPLPDARLYFSVGHTSLHTPDILSDLAEQGIERVIMIHDLIPVTHPEYCREGDGDRHRERLRTALAHASRILVNSHYTAAELAAFAEREALVAPPVDVAHLGLEPVFLTRDPAGAVQPYFVHIGTIEARKNLAFLLTVWRRLEERMGARAPQLVLVGRYGWENEAVLDHLQRSPRLRGLVHQASNLPDAGLADLMRNARAVLAPSSVEGFDLPAVEASALGVPLIASDIPAHRELVPHAQLIDPLDGLGWLEAIERATTARLVAPAFDAPTWPGHFARVAACVGLTPDAAPPIAAEPLAPRRKAR